SYWSSGGVLREKVCFDLCQIPEQERLLGSIFLAPEMPDREGAKPGRLRDQRGAPDQWMTAVTI
ncbi:MAG: Nitroreductase, partial [uncultured Thiotrichaceae bacterium]